MNSGATCRGRENGTAPECLRSTCAEIGSLTAHRYNYWHLDHAFSHEQSAQCLPLAMPCKLSKQCTTCARPTQLTMGITYARHTPRWAVPTLLTSSQGHEPHAL